MTTIYIDLFRPVEERVKFFSRTCMRVARFLRQAAIMRLLFLPGVVHRIVWREQEGRQRQGGSTAILIETAYGMRVNNGRHTRQFPGSREADAFV